MSLMKQNGFALVFVLFLTLLTIGLVTGVLYSKKSAILPLNNSPEKISLILPSPTPNPTPTSNPKFEEIHQPILTPPIPTSNPIKTPTPTPAPTESIPSFPQTSTITVKGDNACVLETEQALGLLREKAPVHYDIITKYIGVIECSDRGSGMYAWEEPPRYQVGKPTRDAGVIWYAGTIAHDSCHSKQYHDYLSNNPSGSVPDDVWTGREAERQCLDVQYDALTKIDADQAFLDYVRNSINSEYWNVGYDNVWW